MYIFGMQKTSLLDYPGHTATVLFTGGCNFRCPYCQNGDLVLHAGELDAYDEEEVFAHLKKRKGVLDGVVITGGEPTLQSDLEAFIEKVKALGYLIKLDTNGTHPGMLKGLLQKRLLDYVAMDIKNAPAKYRETVGIKAERPFDFGALEESVTILLSGDIPYEFRTTVVPELHTEEDMHAMGAWIKGADHWYLQGYRESDAVISPVFTSPSKAEMERYLAIAKDYVKEAALRGDYV